jgi:hypothetical protein
MGMPATAGRIVNYTLTEADVIKANTRSGDQFGNQASAGDVYPAMVVRTFNGGLLLNLQVFMDGNYVLWVTSRVEGAEQGMWLWPTRQSL